MGSSKAKGYAQWIFVVIAIAGIVWNAATLHNDVKHLKGDLAEVKEGLKEIKAAVFVPGWETAKKIPE